jgi:hypothetical protein
LSLFTKNWLSGLDRDQSNSWENIFLNWVEQNWTLPDPPKYDSVTAPYGVLFGTVYNGQWDYVVYTEIKEGFGIEHQSLDIGGRLDRDIVNITLTFSLRNYSVQGGDEIPMQVAYVTDFIEDLIDSNPRALQNEGIRYMEYVTLSKGEKQMYGQQIFEMSFLIRCYVSRINLTD